MTPKLDIKARAFGVQMVVSAGVLANTIRLHTKLNDMSITCPAEVFPFATPGDIVTVFLNMVRVGLDVEPEDGLILPKLEGLN